MCGIAATFAYNADAPPVDREELLAMRDRMRSRGPDGEGIWISDDRRIGLAHRRLSIIDLSEAGAQPMWNNGRTACITFNGEIYNYRELRSQFEKDGYQFLTNSDTEVILALYEKFGHDMLGHLRGMYAFVIWDATRQTLFAARDPFGIKPLFYADNGKTIRLASQVKALLRCKEIDTEPEPAGHVGFFIWGSVPWPFTLYRGIRGLIAGHSLTASKNGEVKIRRHRVVTDLLAPRAPAPGPLSRDELRDAIGDSVQHHLVADVPVGVFLSSGLDSTTLAAFARQRHEELKTVTLGFHEYRGTPEDEVPLAEETARLLGAEHQTIWISRNDFESESDRLFDAMDQPSIDGVNTYFVSLAAKRAGLKVALSGLGGDELFAGYEGFQQIPRAARLLRPFGKVPAFGRAFRRLISPLLQGRTSTKYAGLFEYGSTLAGSYLLRRGLYLPWELGSVLPPELIKEGWEKLDLLRTMQETIDAAPDNSRARISALELSFYMRNQLLRDADWAGMAHSVEIRVPFVDARLLERLAPAIVSNDPPSKMDMARSAPSKLPRAVLARPKTGFVVPVRDWLRSPDQRFSDAAISRGRGLRGWARTVHGNYVGGPRRATKGSKRTRAMVDPGQRRILVYRIGQLGDTIIAMPAMKAIRAHFPDAHIELLCDKHEHSHYVLAADVLEPTGIFDGFITYDVDRSKSFLRSRFHALAPILRQKAFDTLVYLAPSQRTPRQLLRDRFFFKLAGIQNLIGFDGFSPLPPKTPGEPLAPTPREGELLLRRLAANGISESGPSPFELSEADLDEFRSWHRDLPDDGGRLWVAVGPGSKMPAKRWPVDRFAGVISELIREHDIWPIIFGGKEDREIAHELLRDWGRGYNAAGALSVRTAIAAMRHCAFFLGNDTGTMHMAAAAEIPCVAIFSSRDRPGLWYPAGEGHRVFRSEIDCEGCDLVECVVRDNECLKRITETQVLSACREIMAGRVSPAGL